MPSKAYKLRDHGGRKIILWFERDPDDEYPLRVVQEKWFKTNLIRRFDFRNRGVSRRRLRRLLDIKEMWEKGEGDFNANYIPSPSFCSLGRPLTSERMEEGFYHK